MRGIWLGRSEPSACVMVHVSTTDMEAPRKVHGGGWGVVKAFKSRSGEPAYRFAKRVYEESFTADLMPFNFNYDWISSDDDKQILWPFQEEISRLDRDRLRQLTQRSPHYRHCAVPAWLEPEKLTGKSGLDVIDNLIHGTLNGEKGNEEYLVIGPQEMLEAIEDAKSHPESFKRGVSEIREGAWVESPLLKALRMLGINYYPQIDYAAIRRHEHPEDFRPRYALPGSGDWRGRGQMATEYNGFGSGYNRYGQPAD